MTSASVGQHGAPDRKPTTGALSGLSDLGVSKDVAAQLRASSDLGRIAGALEQLANTTERERIELVQREIAIELTSSASKAAESIAKLREPAERIAESIAVLGGPELLQSLRAMPVESLRLLGALIEPALSRAALLGNLIVAAAQYSSEMSSNAPHPELNRDAHVEYSRNLVSSFVKLVMDTRHDLELRTEDIQSLSECSGEIKAKQAAILAQDDDDTRDPLSEIFGRQRRPQMKVPLHEESPLLTAILFDLAGVVPRQDRIEEVIERKEVSPVAFDAFLSLIHLLGDPGLLTSIKSDTILFTVTKVLRELDEVSTQLEQLMKDSGVHRALGRAYEDGSRTFQQYFDQATRIRREGGQGTAERDRSRVGKLLDFLGTEKLSISNYRPATQVPTRAQSLELFEELQSLLDKSIEVNRGVDGGRKMIVPSPDALLDLARSRDDAFQIKTGRDRQSKLERDDSRGNYCFELDGGDSDKLRLRQVPTSGVAMNELVGSSWNDVVRQVDKLVRYQNRHHLYSSLSPRGKVNNNILIIGPYGMGKNHFVRALESKSELLLVKATTDRLMSKWLGVAEQNVRKMFTIALEAREQHQKPAVIALDEIDQFFPARNQEGDSEGSHHAIVGMQKTLQTVLDGDTRYEGVALIGLTNEPARIPVPVFRRFGSVHVIKALTESERRQLFSSMVGQLPLEPSWELKFDWKQFELQTRFASGDLIGKVIDEVFEHCLLKVDKLGERALEFNEQVRDRVKEHGKVTAAVRQALWRDLMPDVQVSSRIVEEITFQVLAKDQNRLAREQQKRFYEAVDQQMERAFGGSI